MCSEYAYESVLAMFKTMSGAWAGRTPHGSRPATLTTRP